MARRRSRYSGVLRRSMRTRSSYTLENEAGSTATSNASELVHDESSSSPEHVVGDVTASPEASADDIVVIDLTSSTDSPSHSALSPTFPSLPTQLRQLAVNPACPFRITAFDSKMWDEGWCRLTTSAIRSFAPSILSIGGRQSLVYTESMVVASFREWNFAVFTWEQLKRIVSLLHDLFTSKGYKVPQKLSGMAGSKKSLIFKIEGFLRFGGSSFEPCPIHSILREIGPIVPVCVCFKESVEELFSARQHWMSSTRAALTPPESELPKDQERACRPVLNTSAYRKLFVSSERSKFVRNLSRVVSSGPGHQPLDCHFGLSSQELSDVKSGQMKVILAAFNLSTKSLIPFDLTTASYIVNGVRVSCLSPILRGGVVLSNLLRYNAVSINHLESVASHSMPPTDEDIGCVGSIPWEHFPNADGSLSGSVMFELCLLYDRGAYGLPASIPPLPQLGFRTESIRKLATIRWNSPTEKPVFCNPELLLFLSEKRSIYANEGVLIAHPYEYEENSSITPRIDPRSFIGVRHMVSAVALGSVYLLSRVWRPTGILCSGSSTNFGRRDPVIYCTFYFVKLSLPKVQDSLQLLDTAGPLLAQQHIHTTQRLATFSVKAYNPPDVATVMLSCRTCNRICPTVQEFSVYWNGHRLPLSLSTASSLVPMHALDENSPSTVVVVGPRFKTCTVLVRVSIANPPPPSASRSLRPALLSAAHRPVAVPKGRRWNQSSTDLTATVKSLPLSGEERRVDEGVVACSEVQVSLRCPLAMCRIRIPVKGSSCKHLQPFDYESFVQYSRQRNKWLCPICGLAASSQLLRVCVETEKALATMPESIDRVLMSSQGVLKGPGQPDMQYTRRKRPAQPDKQCKKQKMCPRAESLQGANIVVKNEVPDGVDPLSGTVENPLCCF